MLTITRAIVSTVSCGAVDQARAIIIGGGVVGVDAAKMAPGPGANATVPDISLEYLRYFSDVISTMAGPGMHPVVPPRRTHIPFPC